MKMAYETPKMKAELFQANQYVAACEDGHKITGRMFVWLNGIQYWFNSNSERQMVNQNSGDLQYYWTEETRSNYYLEYSQHVTDLQDGVPAFLLYKEAEVGQSGFYNAVEVETGEKDYWGRPVTETRYDLIGSADYYDKTLQVNDGWGPTYEDGEDWNYKSTSYLDTDGTVQTASAWYADSCLGIVDKFDETVEIVNS